MFTKFGDTQFSLDSEEILYVWSYWMTRILGYELFWSQFSLLFFFTENYFTRKYKVLEMTNIHLGQAL